MAQTLWFRRLFHTGVGTLAGDNREFHHPGTNAGITVASLNLSHIWALQHGNLVEVKTGLLGIDEACSGIRSLEATLLVSLFLGEIYRLNWRRRVLLVLSGVVIAFLCNVGRTFLLSAVAAENGTEAISKWHDPAGVIILSICFFVLWGLTHFVSGKPPRLEISKGVVSRPFPRAVAIGLGGWLFAAILGTENWYRAHESGEKLKWSIEFPSTKEHFADCGDSGPPSETVIYRAVE